MSNLFIEKIKCLKILLIIIELNLFTTRDIYFSLDNTNYKQSNLMQGFNLTKSQYHFNKMFFSEDLDVPENSYIFSLVQSTPPQDVNFNISKVNKTGGISKLVNYSVNEYIHTSNIFYNKLKGDSNQRKVIYYDKYNNTSIKNEFTKKFDCNINYTGIKYKEKIEEINNENIFSYKQVINFMSLNFVLYKNKPGIFIEKFIEGKLANRTSLEKVLENSKKTENFNFTKIKFNRLFYSYRYQLHNLIAIDENEENLFIFSLTTTDKEDLYKNEIKIEIKLLLVLNKDALSKIDVNLHLINSVYLQIDTSDLFLTQKNSTASSFHLINFNHRDEIMSDEKITEFSDPNSSEKIPFEIISAGYTQYICYMAIRNYGVIYYDWKYKSLGVLLKHPKISHLDYFSYDVKNLGIYLSYNSTDISPNESQEYLLELVKTDFKDRENLNINKIFYTEKSKNFSFEKRYSLLDELGNVNFFIEKSENKMYYIRRNLPYQYYNIDSKINLPEELSNKDFEMFNLISVYQKGNSIKLNGIVKLQLENRIYSFDDFIQNEESVFVCEINLLGKYIFLSEFARSSLKDNTIYTYQKNIDIKGFPQGENRTFGIIIIVLAILALILGGLMCRYKINRQNDPRNDYSTIN